MTRRKLLFIIMTLLIIVLLIEKMNELAPHLDFIKAVTLIATAGILLWYTIETYKLRKQSVLQTEIQIRPLLITHSFIIFGEEPRVIIKNIGNGVALNVETEDIVVHEPSIAALIWNGDTNEPIRVSFDKINVISQSEEKTLPMKVFIDGPDVTNGPDAVKLIVAELGSRRANRNYEFKLKYENINGDKYQSVVTTGKDGVHIKEIGKV